MMSSTCTNVRREQFLARQRQLDATRERDVQRRILATTTKVVEKVAEVERRPYRRTAMGMYRVDAA